MEWQLRRIFTKEVDGYDGYNFVAYMDGYMGDPDFDLDSFSAASIEDVYYVRRVAAEKLEYYTSFDNPTERIQRRIARLQELLTRQNGLIDYVETMDGY